MPGSCRSTEIASAELPGNHHPTKNDDCKTFGPLRTPSERRISKYGRKAKRALRSRIKPKQQRLPEHMRGPATMQPSQGVPRLPRGGDGLALVSLRPSLGAQGRRLTTVDASSPRRPSTAPCQSYRVGYPTVGEVHTVGQRPVMSGFSPLESVDSGREKECLDDDITLVENIACRETGLPKSHQYPHIYPLRPACEKERSRQPYADIGQRTIRKAEMSAPGEHGDTQIDEDCGHGERVRLDEPSLEPGPTLREPTTEVERDNLPDLLPSTEKNVPERDQERCRRPEEEEERGGAEEEERERGATVVLSSNVLLSPRGRAKTPALLVEGAGSHASPGASGDRVTRSDVKGECNSGACAAFDGGVGLNGGGHPKWLGASARRSLNYQNDKPWTPPADIREGVITEDQAATIERLWTEGSVLASGERNTLASTVFGTDEFAGDREIACFLATATDIAETEAAAAAQATSLAAATTEALVPGAAGVHSVDEVSVLSPKLGTTLVAVPIHSGDPSRRYNPYHLRIVSREVDGGGVDGSQGVPCDMDCEELSVENCLRETDGILAQESDGGGCINHEHEVHHAPGYEKKTLGEEGERGEGDVERAFFSLQGVTSINLRGETSFQSLEEWRQEKERFDHLSGMKIVRGFPRWKYLRAMATFFKTRRVKTLRHNVERGLAALDPVCSSAVREIVMQLQRMESLSLTTAKKGATATYTLDEFFNEQTRNMVEYERQLLDVYDRCGRILGRTVKSHLEAEGLLVMNRGWNQMPSGQHEPSEKPLKAGSPKSGRDSSAPFAATSSSLEQRLASPTRRQLRPQTTSIFDGGRDTIEDPPRSWSFAARQRFECARVFRVIRNARLRMRQTLRGLALDHAESLLGAVTRTVVRVSDGAVVAPNLPTTDTKQPKRPQPHISSGEPRKNCLSQLSQPIDVHLGGLEEEGDDVSGKCDRKARRKRNPRYEVRQSDAWNTRWALDIDEEDMGDLPTLALDGSLLDKLTDGRRAEWAGEGPRLVVKWRKAFRSCVTLSGGRRHLIQRCSSWSFCSRISLPDKCLSMARAIKLACELVPHAEETLAIGNPSGAKPVLIELFEAEIPPNLRGDNFFPITHRFYGEKQGVTEDVFVSAVLKLSAACVGGIDAQLSEVSSDRTWTGSEDDEGEGVPVSGVDNGQQHETGRPSEGSNGRENPTVLEPSLWDEKTGLGSSLNSEQQMGRTFCGGGGPQDNRVKMSWMRQTQSSEIYGAQAGPCGGISIEVDIRGNFHEWDFRVFPPLNDFVDRIKSAQLQALSALARVPCLLDHPEVKPYRAMVEDYGLGFELPQGGSGDGCAESENSFTAPELRNVSISLDQTLEDEGRKVNKVAGNAEGAVDECDWLQNLSDDPYYRGLQDKVLLSLASSHNAVYRMVDGFQPLLEEFQALGTFAAEKEARDTRLQTLSDPDCIAAKLVASAERPPGGGGKLSLTPVLLAKSISDWIRGWYWRFERYRQTVRATSTNCPQALLSVNATYLMSYLAALPEASVVQIRLIGPRLMLNAAATLGAVFRRCNAVLAGGLIGVNAMGEKARFLAQIEEWLWQLRDEVTKFEELRILLREIGCFDPRLSAAPSKALIPPSAKGDGSSAERSLVEAVAPPYSGLPSTITKNSPTFPTGGRARYDDGNDALNPYKEGISVTHGESAPSKSGNIEVSGAPSQGGQGGGDGRLNYDVRMAENETQEALESLRFHLSVLQCSVDQAHINMRIASQDFHSLLKKALESLSRDIEHLETDLLDPAMSSVTTDPMKACSRLEGYRHRLESLQEEESRYRDYSKLLDADLVKRAAKGGSKQQTDQEKMRHDLARVNAQRRQLVLKWEAHREVFNIREEWDNSTLILCNAEDMADRLSLAAAAHAFAATAGGGVDEVLSSCQETLAHLGRVVETVGFLQNRDLTTAYWERVEQIMPLAEDMKTSARNAHMTVLRHAAGLDTLTPTTVPSGVTVAPHLRTVKVDNKRESSSSEATQPLSATEGSRATASKQAAVDRMDTEVKSGGGVVNKACGGHDETCVDGILKGAHNLGVNQGGEKQQPDQKSGGEAVLSGGEGCASATETPRSTPAVSRKPCLGDTNVFSSLATGMLRPKKDGLSKTTSIVKAAAVVSSGMSRERRGEARRHAELYEAFPMASEWGGLSLATLLRRGLLERRREIGSISAEATASAVLRKTLEELERVWEAAPMMFCWRFREGAPAPGDVKLPSTVNEDSLRRRQQYSRVLAEPSEVSRGYSVASARGSLGSSGGSEGGENNHSASEGYTSLASNGDELLRLAEHCRVVVDSVVDAPSELLAVGNIGKAALEWQRKIYWCQELVTHWMAVQEQWVRLAPAFVTGDPEDGVPVHEIVRFTDVSGSFQSILATLRADSCLSTLAEKHHGVERGGRTLLAKVRKLREDLEVVSLSMDRRLCSYAAVCPRLLALPRHLLFRLFRDWAAGRVGSGASAGEMSERISCMFRGVGEIVWKEVVSTTSGMNVRTHMAATGVRSSGAGLEVLPFLSPVIAIGRFEIWVRNLDRQIVSAIVKDVETAIVTLRLQSKPAAALIGSDYARHVGVPETAGENHEVSGGSVGSQSRSGNPSMNQPAVQEAQAAVRTGDNLNDGPQPSVQGQLLARSVNWTTAVEEALSVTPLGNVLLPRGGSSGREASRATNKPEKKLQEVLSSVLLGIDGWMRELCQTAGMTAYHVLTNTALITQALQHREVLEEVLRTISIHSPSTTNTTASKVDDRPSMTPRSASTTPSSFEGREDIKSRAPVETEAFPPFLWTCHLRHYYSSPEVAKFHNGGSTPGAIDSENDNGGNAGHDASSSGVARNGERPEEGDEHGEQEIVPPPPPVIRVGLGPWNIPYGFEYAGTLERLWLTPLSERCLLHAVHSAKGRYGGLLVSASASHHLEVDPIGRRSKDSPSSPVDISSVAQDVAIAFGRPFRLLHSGCVTSPQAVSSTISSTLMCGGVTVFAGIDQLPQVSMAVLAESLRAVMLCLHAGQEKVLVNGEEVPLSTTPHLLPNFDPILHQWKLLPWGRQTPGGTHYGSSSSSSINCAGVDGPFLGFFATLAKKGASLELPLSVRSAFRPVLTAMPNTTLLLEAMLSTNGFMGARDLVRGLVQGLRELQGVKHGRTMRPASFRGAWGTTAAVAAAVTAPSVSNSSHQSGTNSPNVQLDVSTLLHAVAAKAVRTATGLLAPETARELRAAKRKLGLTSLTSSERKEKIEKISRAVEARALIAGFVRALLFEETGRDPRALKLQKTTKSTASGSGVNTKLLATTASKGSTTSAIGSSTSTDAGQVEIDSRRAAMVSVLQQTRILRDILKPLDDLAANGRSMTQKGNMKQRVTDLAASGTATRSRDIVVLKSLVKRALIMTGISPTKDQIDAASDLWQALWSCSRTAVIVTGEAGIGKSSILRAMPRMAEDVGQTNRKLNKWLKKQASTTETKNTKAGVGKAVGKGQAKTDPASEHPAASPLDPPGAIFEPPANTRGAASYRRIVNRQVPFVTYITATSGFRKSAAKSFGGGGTVVSNSSGSSKGTKSSTMSDTSNVSGASSDGGASVFSQRSAGTKTSAMSGAGGKNSTVIKPGFGDIPRAAVEGSAFVIPAQEVEVVYTGGCSVENLIGSTDDKGSWLDGLLLRRLRVLAEGIRGGAHAGKMRSRHRACGVGTGDVCPPIVGVTSGFSHGCKSRLLVLDGPVSRILEGILAGDHPGAPSLTGPEECGHNARCLLLPDGESLALDAWGHVAVETGDVRHLSPSTVTSVAIVHLRADGPLLAKAMREAWLKKMSRKNFHHPGTAGGTFRQVLMISVKEFLSQEGFIEDGCRLEDTGDAKNAVWVEPGTPASVCASRMRNVLLLLERLLETLVETDEYAIVWQPEVEPTSKKPNSKPSASANKPLSQSWADVTSGVRGVASCFRNMRKVPASHTESFPELEPADTSSILDIDMDDRPPVEEVEVEEAAKTTHVIARQNEMTSAEIQEVEKMLRIRTSLLCVYACVWGMGGHLVGDASRVMCSAYIRESCPVEVRSHIRETNLFDFVVDIKRAKLIPIEEDGSSCPGALPRGMWTLDPYWALQASEVSCPLPPSLVIPSHRLSTVAVATYTLLGMDDARVMVEGPSSSGKTALLSHLLKVMGKGVPNITPRQQTETSPKRNTSLLGNKGTKDSALPDASVTQSGRHESDCSNTDHQDEGGEKGDAESGVATRIHLLNHARRQMARAGALVAAACIEARTAVESDDGRLTTHGSCSIPSVQDVDDAGRNDGASPSAGARGGHGQRSSLLSRDRHALPRSTVYLSMQRAASTRDVSGIIGRALKREKDGVLEPPPGSTMVVFLDDVHFAEACPRDNSRGCPGETDSCAVETIRGVIDSYRALGEARTKSAVRNEVSEEGQGGTLGCANTREGDNMEVGLPRLYQVHPDFSPRATCGPGGDSFGRPSSMAVIAARTRASPTGGPTTGPLHSAGSGTLASLVNSSARYNSTPTVPVAAASGGGDPMSPKSPVLRNLPEGLRSNNLKRQREQQQQELLRSSSFASPTDRLWKRFFLLALESPSKSELRSVFSRACSDAFAGDGSVFSAVRGPTHGPSSDRAIPKTAGLITSEVSKAVDAMGGIAADFLDRLHSRLLKESSSSPLSTSPTTGAELMACRLDFSTLQRLLRPLVLGRTGDISSPAAVQRFFCHEIIREVVEPLRESWKRKLALSELARVIRERAFEIGVETNEERRIIETWLPQGAETPPMWTNARGLVMAVAYWEQQATKAIMAHKTASDKNKSQGAPSALHPQPDGGVSYLEVCLKNEDTREEVTEEDPAQNRQPDATRTMVFHGVLINTKHVLSTSALTKHFARAVEMLKVPWPARPDSRPLVTPQDVSNTCKCLRQLSLPGSPLVVLHSESRGMSREGGPESAFRFACALEGAELVVTESGAGRMSTKLERENGATTLTEDHLLSVKANLRKAVLTCIGMGFRGPHLGKSRDGGEDLLLNPGSSQRPNSTSNPQHMRNRSSRFGAPDSSAASTDVAAGHATSRAGNGLEASCYDSPAGPMFAVKTVLLVKGAANLWRAGDGEWGLQALMDLVQGGNVWRLFSDAELLNLVGAEEEHEQGRATHATRKPALDSLPSRGVPGGQHGPRTNRSDETRGLGERSQSKLNPLTPGTEQMLRWSCWTRGGIDYVYRRIVSYVRQSLTVALCLDDEEAEALSPSFPALLTCPRVRLEAWSASSMQLAASRSLSSDMTNGVSTATEIETASYHKAALPPSILGEEKNLAGVAGVTYRKNGLERAERSQRELIDEGGVCLWPGATHAHLVGGLAFGRSQSTVPAFQDTKVVSSGPGSVPGPDGTGSSFSDRAAEHVADLMKRDAKAAAEESERLFDAWMTLVTPSCCINVFQAVEACAGGGGGDGGGGFFGEQCSPGGQSQPSWDALKARCFSAMAEEGRGPRPASVGQVLLLFKHLCRLGCRRIVDRIQTLRRAMEAAKSWGVYEASREAEKVDLNQRARGVLDALDENSQQVRRVQQEKTRVQEHWNELSKAAREERQSQYARNEEVEASLQPIRAGYEASKYSLSSLQDEDMEFLCTLCLGDHVSNSTVGTSSHVAAAAKQRKHKGLHPELPFVVETVAVLLGNLSSYPQWVGEWVRLKASPSARAIRALLLDPAIADRLNSFDPESDAGQKVAKLVIEKMTERAVAEASKKNTGDAPKGAPGNEVDGHQETTDSAADTVPIQYAKQMPIFPLKMESRACGLLAAWVQSIVTLVDALCRAEEIRGEIQADAKATRREEERIRAENAQEVAPLDEELALRATYKSRLSTRQRTVHHRRDLVKELGTMSGAVEDFEATCQQEVRDLVETAELFAGDALCFANITCLASHLPYTLRAIAIDRARETIQRCGIPVSRPNFIGAVVPSDDAPTATSQRAEGTAATDNGGVDPESKGPDPTTTSRSTLTLGRYCLNNYVTGVLTNLMQLQNWAYPPQPEVEDDGGESDESDGGRGWGAGAGGDPNAKNVVNAAGLPFHPAFLDAAMLTLSTPKWPLVVDPEGIALRWLRLLYPGQSRLEALVPASMVTMELIAACASKGEILPVCFTEGGLHSDLALFLESQVLPIGAARNKESIIGHQDDKRGMSNVGSGIGNTSDGYVAVGRDRQCSTTSVFLKSGFRLILFETSPCLSSQSHISSSSSLIFLRDSPDALAGIQLVRFGGVDSVGVSAADHGVDYLPQGVDILTRNTAEGVAESSSSESTSDSSCSDVEEPDIPVPTYVLAGMGVVRQPGFEMSKAICARVEQELWRVLPRRVLPPDVAQGTEAEQQQMDKSTPTLAMVQREALAYSYQLNSSHEAVIALLAARPPCFEAGLRRSNTDSMIPRGGEPTTGVSDEIERDQNRILNNLIETLFAYKTTLEMGAHTVPKCNRASQEKMAMDSGKAEDVARCLTSSTLRFLAHCGDMLHAWGSDPALYSPVFPGVRALVHGAIRKVANDIETQNQRSQDVKEVAEGMVLGSLTQSMITRVPRECEWVVPLAAVAVSRPDDFPSHGWWDACVTLLADRQCDSNGSDGMSSRLTLGKLFRMAVAVDDGTGLRYEEKYEIKLNQSTMGTSKTEGDFHGSGQLRAVVDRWLKHCEAEIPKLNISENNTTEGSSSDSGEDDSTRHDKTLSPQRWDLGFNTSDWVRDRGAAAVAALARDRGIPFGTEGPRGEESKENTFFCALSQLWDAAKADRAAMNVVQAAEARPFSRDDILHRLVFLEAAMRSVFTRLPGYVMCEARRWLDWIAKVRYSLVAAEIIRDRPSIDSLRYTLMHPPPMFQCERKVRHRVSLSSSSSSETSDRSSGSDSGENSDSSEHANGAPTAEEGLGTKSDLSYTESDAPSLSIAGEAKLPEPLLEEGAAHSKVRRDSRERMKIKLGLLDGFGTGASSGANGNDASTTTKAEINARASDLFGVSTSATRRGISISKLSHSAAVSNVAVHDRTAPRSSLEGQVAKPTMAPTKDSSVSIGYRDEDGEEEEEEEEQKFITFVAESFRPRRDDSGWHKEKKSVPTAAVSMDALVVAGGDMLNAVKSDATGAVDVGSSHDVPSSSANSKVDGHQEGDAKQQISPPVKNSASPLDDTGSGSETLTADVRGSFQSSTVCRAEQDSPVREDLDTGVLESPSLHQRSDHVKKEGGSSQANAYRRAAKIQNLGRAGMTALSIMRCQRKKRRQQLEVSRQELGSWAQSWNASPLIGIILLLALVPQEDLATKCAAACLMAEGGQGNLFRSSLWEELEKEYSQGIRRKGQIQLTLETSRRWTPTVVMVPANDDMSDAVSRHFTSVLSHIERAAKKQGTTVTVHDASKPAHMLLPRGVLVTQANRVQKGQPKGEKTNNRLAADIVGSPATADMTQSAWEVCLKAATHGGWVVVKDFEGVMDHISLILDGMCLQSAARNAAAAAAEEQEKFHREQQIAGKMTAAKKSQVTAHGSFSHNGTGLQGKENPAQQAGGQGLKPTAIPSAGTRRMKLSRGEQKNADSASKTCPEHPLFKALSPGEVGAMSTKPQTIVSMALRRPLPVPHKNFRIIFLTASSPANRSRDDHRSFCMGESTVIWWRPAPVLPPKSGGEVDATAKGKKATGGDLTFDSCRDEILQELVCSTAEGDCSISGAEAGMEIITESFTRYIKGESHGMKTADEGVAINMHLASLLLLREIGAEQAAHRPHRPTSMGSQAFSPRRGSEDSPMSRNIKALPGIVDGAIRASVVAVEGSKAPIVDLVAGVLDAEGMRAREMVAVGTMKTVE